MAVAERVDDRGQRLAGRRIDLQHRSVVERGRAAVDDRERARLEREPGDRPDLERRADDEHERGAARELGRALHRARRKQLAEEHDAGLQDLAAVGAERRRPLLELREHVRRCPRVQRQREADGGADRAVHLDDLAAARARVQRVDVLGDHRLRRARGARAPRARVAGVRLRLEERVDPRPVEAPDALGIAPERLDRRDLERIDLGPDPASRSGSPGCRSRSRSRRRSARRRAAARA